MRVIYLTTTRAERIKEVKKMGKKNNNYAYTHTKILAYETQEF